MPMTCGTFMIRVVASVVSFKPVGFGDSVKAEVVAVHKGLPKTF